MSVELHFLGWDAPVTTKVREFLLPQNLTGPADLAKDLIVVPTRQAGRRLREALAVHCASQKTALLSPLVVTPAFFLRPENEPANMASRVESAAIWADVLMKADLSHYQGLFPTGTPSQDFTWAMRTGEMIQRLRDTLADGGYLIGDVCRDFADMLEEKDRWDDLAALETAYLDHLSTLGLADSCELMIRYASKPTPPKGTERIVLAAVPDPTPLVTRALEHLAGQVPILVLVHAPESLADCFDGWGRPLVEKWREQRIDMPDVDTNIILTGSPWSQSRKVLELMGGEAACFGPADMAIGVPDAGIIPCLANDLKDRGLIPFDPAGKTAAEHPLYQLLEAFQAVVDEGTYQAFSALLRNADFLEHLGTKHQLPPRRLLEELDRFQNSRLPQTLGDIARSLAGSLQDQEYPNLAKAVGLVLAQVKTFETADLDGMQRAFLQTVYEHRSVNPQKPEDRDFIAVAELIDAALSKLSSESLASLGIGKNDMLELLLWSLGGQQYYPEPEDAVIDLEGWLELPWNDAPFLIVTGMNDGFVPDGQISDLFLPDTLRRQLGLRHDAQRFARDAYLMSALIESRRTQGRVCFIVGKTGSTGDVLKPSRLLFQCTDEELPQRARKLFGSPAEARANCPSSITFPLDVKPPWDVHESRLELTSISVTALKEYLACPFRYYLKRVLGIEELDDLKTEMDALDFGSLVHDVLDEMAQDKEMRRCRDTKRLQDFLCAKADEWAGRNFGSSPPLQVEVQLESAKQRLREAARVQSQLVKEGWEIIQSEMAIEGKLEGILVRGQIDRIDRHHETGRIRVLDYKTSENAQAPEATHFGSISPDGAMPGYARIKVNGIERRWIDLQLPLYAVLLASKREYPGPFETGYFNLPKAVADTGVSAWEGFSPALLDSAEECAKGIIRDIKSQRFWPPATRIQYDDFKSLFPADLAACIDVEAFNEFIRGQGL